MEILKEFSEVVNLRAEIFHRTFFPLPFVNKLQPHLDAGVAGTHRIILG